MANILQVGALAPDFELPDQDGNIFRLSDLKGKKHVVLYFYPKDNTRGCTAQACAFRDQYEDFKEQGAEVVGVSTDSASSHTGFIGKHNLPFRLVSDVKGKVRKLYGVPKFLGLITGRVTFVIDKQGVIRYVFNSMTKPLEHIQNTLTILKQLEEQQA
ncbi:MAG: peroxiredoxin [Hymenobacteraceae bacterium]|nr:peroxiredoxin [Hymenobacteraceae bacterium]